MNRREFMMFGAASALCAGVGSAYASGEVPPPAVKRNAPARNRNPYKGLDWSRVMRVKTTSHGHCTSQDMLEKYLKRGFGLITMSNYYPSAPYVPASKMTKNYYIMHHDHPVMVNGRLTPGPFDWNAIVDGIKDTIDPELAKALPFKEGGKLFNRLPEGVLEAPNAEHHRFMLDNGNFAGGLHMCAPGSAYASGTFDNRDRYKTNSAGYCAGSGEKWRIAIDRMIEGLIYKDGGGVTINHPTWSKLDRLLMLDILDHDPRVLGIEVLEAGRNSESYWDWALATGRQCFGFFVPDWSLGQKIFGVNVLCVEERTVHACMKAYREGNFYGAAHGLDELAFTSLAFDGKCVKASTDKPARFEVITARGVVKTLEGREVTWDVVPDGSGIGPRVDVFARIRATAADGCGEVLYSQPFMLCRQSRA